MESKCPHIFNRNGKQHKKGDACGKPVFKTHAYCSKHYNLKSINPALCSPRKPKDTTPKVDTEYPQCQHTFKYKDKKGQQCEGKSRDGSGYCSDHKKKPEDPNQKYCITKIRSGKREGEACGKKVKEGTEYCGHHSIEFVEEKSNSMKKMYITKNEIKNILNESFIDLSETSSIENDESYTSMNDSSDSEEDDGSMRYKIRIAKRKYKGMTLDELLDLPKFDIDDPIFVPKLFINEDGSSFEPLIYLETNPIKTEYIQMSANYDR